MFYSRQTTLMYKNIFSFPSQNVCMGRVTVKDGWVVHMGAEVQNFGVLYFDLLSGQKCHPRWCTGRKWHILMAVMRGNRVVGNWLMKWDEVKNSHGTLIDWRTGRRVTSELHDSYFRLTTIQHLIPKIEWALNYYITQSRQKSRQLS